MLLTLILIDFGYVIASYNGIPVSFIICSGALFLVILYASTYQKHPDFANTQGGVKYILKKVNWDILVFMISIYLV